MAHIIRDTALGQILRFVTTNRVLQYPEERDDFQLPQAWLDLLNTERRESNPDITSGGESTVNNTPYTRSIVDDEETRKPETIEESGPEPIVPTVTKDGTILVGWYATDDPENPQTWTNLRRALLTIMLCTYTFCVYVSSAIYTPSMEGVMIEWGVNITQASLGLALFVLGYGLGPMIFSPLSEIASIGRNSIYIVTMFLFVIISIPTALVDNYAGFMFLRFLQGFLGSPCLASNGASLADIYDFFAWPYALMAWVSFSFCGPGLGPLLAGYSVPAMGWRWSMYESIWASAPTWIAMFLFLPETSAGNILLRRAARLRKLTGSPRFRSQSEIDERNSSKSAIIFNALIKPLEITLKDPAIMFVQIYTAIVYGIYYSFFEVFPMVYPVYYNMDYGQVGLVFLCLIVACLIGLATYASYMYFYLTPRIRAHGFPVQESRLVPALGAAFGPTIGLFIFAWTATPTIHWIAPTIGITIYGATVFVVSQ
jgi:MFS transporter, DHA1 family, multidrug resistance protein